jgi:hypothetical protein
MILLTPLAVRIGQSANCNPHMSIIITFVSAIDIFARQVCCLNYFC